MVIFRITKSLLNRTYIINLLEYQKIGILLELHKSTCDIDKFFLEKNKKKIDNLQEKIKCNQMSDIEINEILNNLHNFKNKI